MATDTKISQLIINKLTQAQYNEAKAAGNISDTELYLITDDTGGSVAYLPLTGGTMTGDLYMGNNTIYFGTDDKELYLTGQYGTSGAPLLELYGYDDVAVLLGGIATPIMTDQAANKEYVDAAEDSVMHYADELQMTTLNRSNGVSYANTNYTTLMARGTSLHTADTTPAVNGAICWTYK